MKELEPHKDISIKALIQAAFKGVIF